MLEDAFAPESGYLRYYRVPEPSQSVHPMGKPMSHSTHSGLRVVGRVASPLGSADGLAEQVEADAARLTAIPRPTWTFDPLARNAVRSVSHDQSSRIEPEPWSVARGVGQRTGVLSCWGNDLPVIPCVTDPPRVPSDALGVTQNEDPIADMRGANVGSR